MEPNSAADTRAKIYIDLDASDSAEVMDERQRIQREAFASILNLIQANISSVPKFLSQLNSIRPTSGDYGYTKFDHSRVHNTIAVTGERGSGKTTFLINLFKRIEEAKLLGDQFASLSQIVVLRIIDPTLMEDKEHILISVIGCIQRRVEEKYRNAHDGNDESYRKWWDSLKDLARGLRLLKSIGSDSLYGENWDDAQWALEQGLKNARTGADLEIDFHQFVRQSLLLLGKEQGAFLLAFDDIDTSFERGWPVLEIIRKYLTTPQLIVLLSGDLSLYSKLVRRQQFANLGSELLNHDRPTRERHREQDLMGWERDPWKETVDKLEDQYLLKILQPQNRVSLLTLAFYQRELNHKYDLRIGRPGIDLGLQQFLDQFLCRFLSLNDSPEGLVLFRSALLQQPVRTSIQILRAGHPDRKIGDAAVQKAFLDTVTDIAASALYHVALRPEQIKMGDGSTILWAARTWLTSENLWDEGYRLLPNYRSNERNLIAVVLGGQLAHQIRISPGIAVLQMLTLGMVRELIVTPWSSDAKTDNASPQPTAIFEYLGLELEERSTTMARRLVNALRSKRVGEAASQPFYGTMAVRGEGPRLHLVLNSLYGEKYTRTEARQRFEKAVKDQRASGDIGAGGTLKPPDGIRAWFERVVLDPQCYKPGRGATYDGVVYNTRESLAESCGFMAPFVNLAASNMPDDGGRETEFLSIFNLLGAVGDLMKLAPAEQASISKEIDEALRRLGEIRTYPRPPWAKRASATSAAPPQEDEENDSSTASGTANSPVNPINAKTLEFIKSRLEAWVLSISHNPSGEAITNGTTNGAYHPHVYARMTTRFFYTLTRMDEVIQQKDWYAGHLLHRQIIALLNAILVEERLALGKDLQSLTRTNPTLKDAIFFDNLRCGKVINLKSANQPQASPSSKKVFNNDGFDLNGLPFFTLIASCPLWALYVRPESEIRTREDKPGGTWQLLDFLLSLWPKASGSGATETGDVKEVIEDKVDIEFAIGDRSVTFPNLFDPLNSIDVLGKKGIDRDRPKSQGRAKNKPPEESEDQATPPLTPEEQ